MTADQGATWRDITPPDLGSGRGTQLIITDLDFIDPLHGWLVGSDCAAGKDAIFRTTDGGTTWARKPVRSTSCNAGAGHYLDFLGPSLGWDARLEPTGPGMSLLQSADGGTSWSNVGLGAGSCCSPVPGPVHFTDAAHGWEVPLYFKGLNETSDGGNTWHPVTFPLPGGIRSRHELVTLPVFSDPAHGVMAITVPRRGAGAVVFDATDDGGRTWHVSSVLHLHAASGPRRRSPVRLAAAVGSTSTWWVLADNPCRGYVTSDAGGHWRTVHRCFWSGRVAPSIQAVGDSVAWVSQWEGRHRRLEMTDDAGRSWKVGCGLPVSLAMNSPWCAA